MAEERIEAHDRRIAQAEEAVLVARRRLAEARRARPPEPFEDHVLVGPEGRPLRLSEMFDGKDDLLVVHNMGSGCPYCTLWADGFNGLLPHLEDRAAFVVVTPDAPERQRMFAGARAWRFRMASDADRAFSRAAGFAEADGSALPGVSAFHRRADGRVFRVGRSAFGPGDPYCGLWHLFDLLQGGPGDWEPKFRYV